MTTRFAIPRRYNGPPNVANGGLAAGLFADRIDERVKVRLIKPVPLETELTLSRAEGGWEVYAGDTLVATATAADPLGVTPPRRADYAEALDAATRYPGRGGPRFSGCFVCGAARSADDGMRIFSGSVGPDQVLAPWTPTSDLADDSGSVRPEFVWAALDCPGYFAAFQDDVYALLGELTVQIDAKVAVGEPLVIVGWTVAHQGRKRLAGTGLIDAHGVCRARGLATWIEVRSA